MSSWDMRFLGLAQHIASWSKDPSTKCGAVIVDQYNRIISLGYNGFARGVEDSGVLLNARDEKLRRIIHAETNAILFAERSLLGCTLYTWPIMSCARCASLLIQVGVARHVAPRLDFQNPLHQRWADEFAASKDMLAQAGVELDLLAIGVG